MNGFEDDFDPTKINGHVLASNVAMMASPGGIEIVTDMSNRREIEVTIRYQMKMSDWEFILKHSQVKERESE